MYLIHHIFLPPQLPDEDDFDSEYEKMLLDTTVSCLLKFKTCLTCEQATSVDLVVAMVTNMRTVRKFSGGEDGLMQGKLEDALKDLCQKGKHKSQNQSELNLTCQRRNTSTSHTRPECGRNHQQGQRLCQRGSL